MFKSNGSRVILSYFEHFLHLLLDFLISKKSVVTIIIIITIINMIINNMVVNAHSQSEES